MSQPSTSSSHLPTQLEGPILQLEAIAALLNCVDLDRWDSLGRPCPRGLSALVYRATGDLQSGLEELKAA